MKEYVKNHKKALIASAILLVIIAIVGIFFIVKRLADSPDVISYVPTDEPYWQDVTEGALKVGKYYVDGDTSQYYLEVTEEGTIQLKGVDYYEYVKVLNFHSPDEEIPEYIELAEDYSKPHKYVVGYIASQDAYCMLTHYTMGRICPTGYGEYRYVDKNTLISGTGDSEQIFIYRDESSEEAFTPPEKKTQIVDAVFTEE